MNEQDLQNLLRDAVEDVAEPADLETRAERTFRKRRAQHRLVGAAILTIVLFAGVSAAVAVRDESEGAVSVPPTTAIAAKPRLSLRFDVVDSMISSGMTGTFHLVADNNTGAPITLRDDNGCAIKWALVLNNARTANDAAFAGSCDREFIVLEPGETRFVLEVRAVYTVCHNDEATRAIPRCDRSGVAPLPGGEYNVELQSSAPLPMAYPTPARVAVQEPQVQVHLELPTLSVRSGEYIDAVLVIENSGSSVPGFDCTDVAQPAWLDNGLASSRMAAVYDCVGTSVPRGTDRRTVRLYARYGMCVAGVRCEPRTPVQESFPPLPPGEYELKTAPALGITGPKMIVTVTP